MHKNKLKEINLIILVTVVFILAALNSNVYFKRFDLTENKSFTISESTKKIISSLPDKVHITYFISDKVKTVTPVATEIEDLLNEYAANSRGKIDVLSIEPQKSTMTTRIESLGITPQQIEIYEKNQQSFAMIYSGIAIQYMDKVEIIPFTLNLESLEYDVTHRIRKLVEDNEIIAGILIGDSEKNLESDYSYLAERVGQNYTIEQVARGQEIPQKISVLAVIGNKDLSDGDMLYVDEFIMNGGRVIFCLDGVDVDMRQNLAATKLENSPAIEMVKKYGIKVNNDFVLDKYAKRIPLRGAFPMLYPEWFGITPQNVSQSNPVTARFAGLDLLWASSVEASNPQSEVSYEKLISTSNQAWTMSDSVTADPRDVSGRMTYKGDDQRQVDVGWLITGALKSAFTEKQSAKSRIIVIGDSDFISNLVEFSDSPYNIVFFENIIEWLSNDESLLQIKTRARRDMHLNKIEEPEAKARMIGFVYLVNIIFIPLAVIIYAVIRYVKRKKV